MKAVMLPRKSKRPRMGVRDPVERTFSAHQRWVRSHQCVVLGCKDGPIQFAHVKSRGAGGGDWYGVALCLGHHREQHDIGIETFQRKYGIDLYELAAEFTRRTSDPKLRELMKELKNDGRP